MIKSAATFRTLGHRAKAMMVNKFPKIPGEKLFLMKQIELSSMLRKIPVIIIIIVAVAAKVNSGLENL